VFSAPQHHRLLGPRRQQFDHSAPVQDVTDSGLAWEGEVVGKLLAGRVAVAAGSGAIRKRRFDVYAIRLAPRST
jgi:hypothetical protein